MEKKVLATREELSFWAWKPADETIKTVMIQRWKLMGIRRLLSIGNRDEFWPPGS